MQPSKAFKLLYDAKTSQVITPPFKTLRRVRPFHFQQGIVESPAFFQNFLMMRQPCKNMCSWFFMRVAHSNRSPSETLQLSYNLEHELLKQGFWLYCALGEFESCPIDSQDPLYIQVRASWKPKIVMLQNKIENTFGQPKRTPIISSEPCWYFPLFLCRSTLDCCTHMHNELAEVEGKKRSHLIGTRFAFQ